jgi:hypothetical protein
MLGSADEAAQPAIRVGFALPPWVFPVYLASWHGVDGRTASVLLFGNLAGGYLLRTVVLEASGACAWDGATPFEPGTDPQTVWDHVERQLDLIGAVGEWGPDEPTVVDAAGFGAGTETVRGR